MPARSLAIFLASLLYAIIRYNVFGEVPPEQIPSYIVNKAVAFASVIALTLVALSYARRDSAALRAWAMASFGFASVHILFSTALWSREYYPQFFGPAKMNWAGETTLLFGVLAASTYGAFIFGDKKNFYILRWLSATLVALHVAAMGWPKWTAIQNWPGYLPPISLLTFLCALASIPFFLRRHHD